MTTTSSDRRLHPVSIILDIGASVPRLLLPLIVLFFATQQARTATIFLFWAGAVLAVSAIATIAQYLRFTYRYGATELVVRSGIFIRNERIIPYVRIQNLDAAQNPVHRLLDVVAVNVQTGGGAEPEATLRVLPVTALDEMRSRVLAAGGRAGVAGAPPAATGAPPAAAGGPRAAAGAPRAAAAGTPGAAAEMLEVPATADGAVLVGETLQEDDGISRDGMVGDAREHADVQPSRTLLALKPGDLVLAGFIENRGMVLIFGALALLQQAGLIDRVIERVFRVEDGEVSAVVARWFAGSGVTVVQGALYVTAAVLAVLLFVRLLSTVWAVVRLYDFRLRRVGDELYTEYGLFTRVSATIPLRRVQTVVVHDGILHRLTGRCSVEVETAGGTAAAAGGRQREPIAPILHQAQLPALLDELHPGLDTGAAEWQPVHRRAFGRMLRGSLAWPIAISAAAILVVDAWALAVFAALLARAALRAGLRARHLSWSLSRDSILVRDGALTRATRIARYNRVQVVALNRNPFDVRTGMASVRADTAGARSGVVVPYLPAETAVELRQTLAERTAATAFTW
jgi:putative membrane protein